MISYYKKLAHAFRSPAPLSEDGIKLLDALKGLDKTNFLTWNNIKGYVKAAFPDSDVITVSFIECLILNMVAAGKLTVEFAIPEPHGDDIVFLSQKNEDYDNPIDILEGKEPIICPHAGEPINIGNLYVFYRLKD